MNSYQKLFCFCLAFCLGMLLLTGCEREEQDEKPEFTEYLKSEDGTAQYALDESTNLYRYTMETDADGAEVSRTELLMENTGGIEQFIAGEVPLLLTKSHVLYADPGEQGEQPKMVRLLEKVKALYIEEGSDTLAGAMAMTEDNSLYGWAADEETSKSDTAVTEPSLLLEEVSALEHSSTAGADRYYGSAALTEAGELYVWDFERSYKDADTGEAVEYRIEAPALRLSGVDRFDLQPNQIIAHTEVGEVILTEDEFLNE